MAVRIQIASALFLLLACAPGTANAGDRESIAGKDPWQVDWRAAPTSPDARGATVWHVDWQTPKPSFPSEQIWSRGMSLALNSQADESQAPRPKAVEYSDGYLRRRKIHFIASFATLPLFATQVVLGQKLYDGSSGGVRTAHMAVATGIAALFAVNSVTGVWNLWEARKDPMHRAKRLTHGLMMLGADAGFVATGMLAPDEGEVGDRTAHRAVALTSMGVATAAYLLMLLTR